MMVVVKARYLASLPKSMFVRKRAPGQAGSRQPRCRPAAPPRPVFQVPVQSWFDDMTDTELLDLIPFFEGLSREDDVYGMLHRLCNR